MNDPEHEAILADSVGLALLVVLETLSPPERSAFVLDDMFAVPFDEIAQIVGRSPDAARQLTSRARRRVRGAPVPDADLATRRRVVGAFVAASRHGDFDALLAVLDPDVVLRADRDVPPGAPRAVHGARAVAARALDFSTAARSAWPALVNGSPARCSSARDGPSRSWACVQGESIAEIDVVTDPALLSRIDLGSLDV